MACRSRFQRIAHEKTRIIYYRFSEFTNDEESDSDGDDVAFDLETLHMSQTLTLMNRMNRYGAG